MEILSQVFLCFVPIFFSRPNFSRRSLVTESHQESHLRVFIFLAFCLISPFANDLPSSLWKNLARKKIVFNFIIFLGSGITIRGPGCAFSHDPDSFAIYRDPKLPHVRFSVSIHLAYGWRCLRISEKIWKKTLLLKGTEGNYNQTYWS